MFYMTPRRKVWLAVVVFLSWLILSSVALFYFGNQHYGQFDPKLQNNWLNSRSFQLHQLGLAVMPGIQVVHVQQANCICNSRAKLHITQFEEKYLLAAQAQTQLTYDQVLQAGLTLPATPAVLVFQHGELIYAGPYATGPLCSVSASIIAPIITKAVTLPGLWLNGEAKACRCLVSSN